MFSDQIKQIVDEPNVHGCSSNILRFQDEIISYTSLTTLHQMTTGLHRVTIESLESLQQPLESRCHLVLHHLFSTILQPFIPEIQAEQLGQDLPTTCPLCLSLLNK